ncbi:MAG: hypothetical protein NVS9B2_23340 [Steroidobacteraceae bacterium]
MQNIHEPEQGSALAQLAAYRLLMKDTGVEVTPFKLFHQEVLYVARHLDPVAARRDQDARAINPDHQNQFLDTSRKEIFLVSNDHKRVFTAYPKVAARSLVNGTHAEATPEHIAQWHRDQEIARGEIQAELDRRLPKGAVTTVVVSAEAIREAMQTPVERNSKRDRVPG